MSPMILQSIDAVLADGGTTLNHLVQLGGGFLNTTLGSQSVFVPRPMPFGALQFGIGLAALVVSALVRWWLIRADTLPMSGPSAAVR